MKDPPRRHYRTFFQTSHLQTSFLILKRVPDVNYCMTHEELEILSYVRVQNHDAKILYCLILAHLILETNGFVSTPI